MKAAIVLDSWKIPFFEKELKEKGYPEYEAVTKEGSDVTTLVVHYENPKHLYEAVTAANNAAAKSRQH